METFKRVIEIICRPNENIFTDSLSRELLFRRNKTFFILQPACFVIVALIGFIYQATKKELVNLVLLHNLTAYIAFLILCRSYPHLFNIALHIIMNTLQVSTIFLIHEAVFANWAVTAMVPVYILTGTGSRNHFLFNSLTQIGFLTFFYPRHFLDQLPELSHTTILNELYAYSVIAQLLLISCISVGLP